MSRLVGKDSHGFSCDVKRFVGRLVDFANFGSSQLACPYCLLTSHPPFPDPLCGVMGGGASLGFQPPCFTSLDWLALVGV